MSNKEKAQLTYYALQKRKKVRAKGQLDADNFSIDNTFRIHKRMKRRYGR